MLVFSQDCCDAACVGFGDLSVEHWLSVGGMRVTLCPQGIFESV